MKRCEPVGTGLCFLEQKPVNRWEPVWTALRFYFVVAFSWAKFLKSFWTGLNRFTFFDQKPWIGVNRFEPLDVFTLLWHFRGLRFLNRSEPVWTGLCFFEQKPWNGVNRFDPVYVFFCAKAMNQCEPVWTALRFDAVVAFSWAQVLKSVWTVLNRFMVFFGANAMKRCKPVWTGLLFSSRSHESMWTGLNRFTFLRCCIIIVG